MDKSQKTEMIATRHAKPTKPMIWLLLERGREIGSFDSREQAVEERELRCGINQRDDYRIIQAQ